MTEPQSTETHPGATALTREGPTATEQPRRPDRRDAPTDWRRAVAGFVGENTGVAIWQLVTTIGLLALTWTSMYLLLSWSVVAALVLALPAAGLLVRTFTIMHDCAHGSFLASRRSSEVVGFLTGVLTLTPFAQWRRDHALHHASSGDLDRRGHGDVPTLTVREYLARSPRDRLRYRILRHPASLLLVGPLHLMVGQRLHPRGAAGRSGAASVWFTNAAIAALMAVVVWFAGWSALLLVYLPTYYLAAMAGVWLFFVQHQFEDAYWESHEQWDYATAALRGSSHLQLPALLQWFTGNIGLHHVHHLSPRIPNYRLQRCHDASPLLQQAPVVTLRSGLAAFRLALWAEDRRRLVRFADVKMMARSGDNTLA
jgi:acyl-lipid omega-6 desaturase (Delta-12 desaturase)